MVERWDVLTDRLDSMMVDQLAAYGINNKQE